MAAPRPFLSEGEMPIPQTTKGNSTHLLHREHKQQSAFRSLVFAEEVQARL